MLRLSDHVKGIYISKILHFKDFSPQVLPFNNKLSKQIL